MKKKNKTAEAFAEGMRRAEEHAAKDRETEPDAPKGNWSRLARQAKEMAARDEET